MTMSGLVPAERIEQRILLLRGCKVMLDSDLARLYRVTTKRLNEQVRRNIARFPGDFMFQLTLEEVESLRSQLRPQTKGVVVVGMLPLSLQNRALPCCRPFSTVNVLFM